MVQVLQPSAKDNLGSLVGRGLGQGLSQGINQSAEFGRIMKQQAAAAQAAEQQAALKEQLKFMREQALLSQKQSFLNQLLGGGEGQDIEGMEGIDSGMPEISNTNPKTQNGFNPLEISDEAIARATAIDPNVGRALRSAKDSAITRRNEDRKYHTEFTKELEKEANQQRASLPKKEMALNFARNALETGDLGYFSLDKLADATGFDVFRTSKGAQLITAAKENLLGNMGRVSSRAQNMWFEQRLNSMFPKIGQSKEANLTVQEMLEGELALDQAYLNAFDEMSQKDEKQYGFVKKDISKRVHDAIRPLEKEIMRRTSYRMKEVEEQEKGISALKKEAGKNVVEGTPLTLAMAKIYKDKFGDNALKVAEKNGYYIPTVEEFQIYQQRPQKFREEAL